MAHSLFIWQQLHFGSSQYHSKTDIAQFVNTNLSFKNNEEALQLIASDAFFIHPVTTCTIQWNPSRRLPQLCDHPATTTKFPQSPNGFLFNFH
jgi:predicted nicotinamide N-methyase